MLKIFQNFGCHRTPISKPSWLRRREMKVTAGGAINIGDTPEETLNVNDTKSVPVEETRQTKTEKTGN